MEPPEYGSEECLEACGLQSALATVCALEQRLRSAIQASVPISRSLELDPDDADREREALLSTREQLELLEEKLRELAALPRGDSRSDDDRAVALSQVDALRKELALVCRAGLPSVVFGKDVMRDVVAFCEVNASTTTMSPAGGVTPLSASRAASPAPHPGGFFSRRAGKEPAGNAAATAAATSVVSPSSSSAMMLASPPPYSSSGQASPRSPRGGGGRAIGATGGAAAAAASHFRDSRPGARSSTPSPGGGGGGKGIWRPASSGSGAPLSPAAGRAAGRYVFGNSKNAASDFDDGALPSALLAGAGIASSVENGDFGGEEKSARSQQQQQQASTVASRWAARFSRSSSRASLASSLSEVRLDSAGAAGFTDNQSKSGTPRFSSCSALSSPPPHSRVVASSGDSVIPNDGGSRYNVDPTFGGKLDLGRFRLAGAGGNRAMKATTATATGLAAANRTTPQKNSGGNSSTSIRPGLFFSRVSGSLAAAKAAAASAAAVAAAAATSSSSSSAAAANETAPPRRHLIGASTPTFTSPQAPSSVPRSLMKTPQREEQQQQQQQRFEPESARNDDYFSDSEATGAQKKNKNASSHDPPTSLLDPAAAEEERRERGTISVPKPLPPRSRGDAASSNDENAAPREGSNFGASPFGKALTAAAKLALAAGAVAGAAAAAAAVRDSGVLSDAVAAAKSKGKQKGSSGKKRGGVALDKRGLPVRRPLKVSSSSSNNSAPAPPPPPPPPPSSRSLPTEAPPPPAFPSERPPPMVSGRG